MGARMIGTRHGVSKEHLSRYLREWNYRLSRSWGVGQMEDFLLRRAATRGTITYREFIDAEGTAGSPPLRTMIEPQLLLPLPPPVPSPTKASGSCPRSARPSRRATRANGRTKNRRRPAHRGACFLRVLTGHFDPDQAKRP